MAWLPDLLGYKDILIKGVVASPRRSKVNLIPGPGLAIKTVDNPLGYTDVYIQLMLGLFVSNARVKGQASTPGWETLAEAALVEGNEYRLEARLLVSDAALTANVRLYDPVAGQVVANSTMSSTSLTGETKLSVALANLVVGRVYQIQVECIGGNADSDYAIVRYATLRGD